MIQNWYSDTEKSPNLTSIIRQNSKGVSIISYLHYKAE